jgi:hypothetical protein
MNGCWGWWYDPGPCPVDDAPHTTCTSPDYQPQRYPMGRRTMTVTVPITPPAAAQTRVSFTTVTYRRGMLKGRR